MHALIRVRLRQALIRRDTRPVDLHSTRIHMILIHTLALHRVGSLRAGQAGQTASTHGMKPTSFQHCGSCLLLFSSPQQGDVSVLSFCVCLFVPILFTEQSAPSRRAPFVRQLCRWASDLETAAAAIPPALR